MENRKRNIQMKFYVTEEEKRLIDEKMKQLPIKQYGAVQKTHSFHRSMSCRFVRVCVCSGWSARSAISTHLRIF